MTSDRPERMTIMSAPAGTVDASVRDRLAAELLLDPAAITPEVTLAALPGLDSIKLLHVVAQLEQSYGISVDDELYVVETVADLVELIAESVA
jgi:acyl carrier protein